MSSKDDEAPAKPTARAQYLCERLHAAGPRPTYEALKEVASGKDLETVLEDYARIPTSFYRLTGASSFVKLSLIWKSTTSWLLQKK